MSKLILGSLSFALSMSLAGSSFAAPAAELEATPGTGARQGAATVVVPTVVEPRLPSVDRIAPQVRLHLGERAVAEVELCVATSGRVVSVTLLKGARYEPFDAALLHDLAAWRFSAMPGPDTIRACYRASVAYRTAS